MKPQFFVIFALLAFNFLCAQQAIRIEEQELPNRLAFYAVNETEQDYDVRLTITGTNFRQSRAKPRFIRVPSSSKVHMSTIVLMRGKKPNYQLDLAVNDSLSDRSLKKEFEKVKIHPKKRIIVYLPTHCLQCDSLISGLDSSPYLYTSYLLSEEPNKKEQLERALGGMLQDTLEYPILNLGGKIHRNISSYSELMEVLEKQ